MTLTLWNGFWLILPVIVWNVVFALRLTVVGYALYLAGWLQAIAALTESRLYAAARLPKTLCGPQGWLLPLFRHQQFAGKLRGAGLKFNQLPRVHVLFGQ